MKSKSFCRVNYLESRVRNSKEVSIGKIIEILKKTNKIFKLSQLLMAIPATNGRRIIF